ncbi:DUF5018 domain-containing protein [Tenacibaculum agarivorans]|uniref:DUF5018 domain-containing protein n=1 Tax=Tenacibaculum agarivorans TaxID=1908389 RepID=UPI00094B8049|nr:DUF5018 domain-containing protein [Tenacibaculum agarivorans]
MKLIQQQFILLAFFLVLFSCSDDNDSTLIEKSTAKEITDFTIDGVKATIDKTTKKISLKLAKQNLTSLTPTIQISDKATVSPKSGVAQDFSKAVTYTVTAEDGSKESYEVSVSSTNTPKSDAKEITEFIIDGKKATIDKTTKKITLSLNKTDLTSLTPTIQISDKATVSPKSGVAQDFSKAVTYTVTAEDGTTTAYNVSVTGATTSTNISTFTHNGKKYEIVKEAKTWEAAAAFAVGRGGYLTEVNDKAEQDAIFQALNKASITMTNTVAPDGGGGAYVWIGGNDITTEGSWVWNGNNQGSGTPFWTGNRTGSVVNSAYVNWGRQTNSPVDASSKFNEPDNFGTGQDGLALSLNGWPLGFAGQWNDVDHTNKLFFVIEFN